MADQSLSIADIAAYIGADIVGDDQLQIQGLGSLGSATAGQLSHLSSTAYRDQLASTKASAVILAEADAADCPCTALVVENPYLAFAHASHLFATPVVIAAGVHPSAVIAPTATVDPSAAIGPNVVIGADTEIGAGVKIYANCVVGERCVLAQDVVLHPNVTIYSQVKIGARSVLHSTVVIGADGFGFTPNAVGHLVEIAQIGGVSIGEDVSIGAGSTVDCGAIDDTVIDDGVKIDNQVQIGHNCRIGAHSVICGMVGLVGSTTIGKHCVFAGGAGAGGDKPITVCDGVTVTARTVLSQSVSQPGVYSGTILFHEHGKWRRNALRFSALDDLFKRVKRLERD